MGQFVRGDVRYIVQVGQAHGWMPAWPQSEFETETGAVLLAQALRFDGEPVRIQMLSRTGEDLGLLAF